MIPSGFTEKQDMADLLFVVVTVASFALLIAFVYACDRLSERGSA